MEAFLVVLTSFLQFVGKKGFTLLALVKEGFGLNGINKVEQKVVGTYSAKSEK